MITVSGTSEADAAEAIADIPGVGGNMAKRLYTAGIFSTEQFHAKLSEIRRFLDGQLDSARTRELAEQILLTGLAL